MFWAHRLFVEPFFRSSDRYFRSFFYIFLQKCTKYDQKKGSNVVFLEQKSLGSYIVAPKWYKKKQHLIKSMNLSYFDAFKCIFIKNQSNIDIKCYILRKY